jgi:hypothetical protein
MTDCLPSKVYATLGQALGCHNLSLGDNPSYHTLTKLIIVHCCMNVYMHLYNVSFANHQLSIKYIGFVLTSSTPLCLRMNKVFVVVDKRKIRTKG